MTTEVAEDRAGAGGGTVHGRRVGLWVALAVVIAGAVLIAITAMRITAKGEVVKKLTRMGLVDFTPVGPAWLQEVCGEWAHYGLNRVKRIEFVSYGPDFRFDFDSLRRIPEVEMLCLYGPGIDGRCMVAVGGLKHVQSLRIFEAPNLKDADIAALRGLTRLQSLNIALAPVTDAMLEHLAGLTELSEIQLVGTETNGSGIRHLASLPKLKSLTVIGDDIRPEAFDAIGSMVQLEALNVGVTDAAAMGKLADLRRLRDLDLYGSGLTDESLAAIGEMAAVTSLSITDSQGVHDAGLAHLAGLKGLRSLSLDRTAVAGDGLDQICDGLEELMMADTQFDDRGAGRLPRFGKLARLDVSHTRITDEGVKALMRLRSLESVDLSHTVITDASLELLATHPTLRTVAMDKAMITHAGRLRFEAAMEARKKP